MKTLVEYITEKSVEEIEEVESQVIDEQDENVWVLKDKDLDGAIFDVCDTEEDAQRLLDKKLEENPDVHMEIVPGKRSEYVKD